MIDPRFYLYWSFWRRVLLFLAGAAALVSQSPVVTAQQGQWLALAVAVLNLAISLLPDAAVGAVTPLKVETR